MLKIEIRTPLTKDCALEGIKEIAKCVEVSVEGLLSIKNEVKGLLKLKAENVESLIARLPEFCEGFKITRSSARVLMKEHPCLIAPVFLRAGAIVTKMRVEGSSLIWSLVCDEENFLKVVEEVEKLQLEYEIVYKGRMESGEDVTFREEEILRIALEKGFFDFPRKIRLEELAKELGMAPSTLSEIMRRGQKKILRKYFE